MNLSTRTRRDFGRVTAAVLIAALTAAGCASGSSKTSGDDNSPLTIYNDNPQWETGFKSVGDSLQKITGRGFSPVALPSTANYQQVVQSSLATNKPGDIVKWWSGLQLQSLAATGNLTDLTAVWDGAVKKGWLDDALRPYYTHDGKVYGLPLTQAYWVIFYSKPVFEKNGITPPKTYEEFKAAAAKLKAAGVTPIWTGQADQWTSFIPYQALAGSLSPEFYTKLTNNQASFGDAESKQVLGLWQDWMKNGWTAPPDSKFSDAPALLKSGQVAMFPIGTWAGSLFKAVGMQPGTDYGAFLMPPQMAGGPQAVFTEGGALAVPKNAPHHDAAMKQMETWLDPSVQKVWSDYLGDSSPNPTVTPADPVISELAAQIKSSNPTMLNRYFESLPPALVQNSTTILDGYMVHPDELDKVIEELKAAEAKDWAAWKQNK